MIRRGVKVQLLAFAVLTAVGLSYVGATYVGLTDKLFGSGFTVTANFGESGGIYENAEVTYRGVTVGRVGELALSGKGVAVPLELEEGSLVPADVQAVVANRSAIGEQYVDLRPRRSTGPYLAGGDEIARASTRTPLSTDTVLLNLDDLVNSVDRGSLATVVAELGASFDGTGDDLTRLVEHGNALTEDATAALPETVRLLEDGNVVLDTQRDSAGDIKAFSRDLADLTETLRTSDRDLRGVLDHGVHASTELTDLLRTSRPALSTLTANLLTLAEMQRARLPALEQVLVTYPANVAGGYTVVPGDGTAHFGLALNANDPPACTDGYGGTEQRTPAEESESDVNTGIRCDEPQGSPTSVRGAQHAPGGPDTPTYRPGGAHGPSGTGDDEAGAATGPPGAEAVPPGYQPGAGQGAAQGGPPVMIGSLGGQQEAFGEDSWKWLLTAPLEG